MSAIQSNVGLITGIPIQQTVDNLIAISGRPRDRLVGRTQGLQNEQAAVDQLSSLVLGLRASLSSFNRSSTFNSRAVTSSNSDAVSASIASGATPVTGNYQFTPLQAATSHQLVSGSFADISEAIGDGSFRFQFGGQVNQGVALRELNGGAGVASGSIRITDRGGSSQTIDLRAAQSVDDVLLAINSATNVNVTATADGDRLVLTDNTGGSGDLSVQDVGLGTTAADLGLTVAASGDTLTGSDIFRLSSSTRLTSLNDGAGVRITDDLTDVGDISITLSDGTQTDIDLSGSNTLGDVIDRINTATNADGDSLGSSLVASLSADGNGITLTDGSGGAGDFTVANGTLGSAATDLGIAGATSGATIDGARLVSGLQDTLVGSLNGGQGFALGEIDVTDSNGGTATIDLSAAETLDDIVSTINNATGVEVAASINANRSGLQITDNAGGSGSLTITNGTAGTTADDLGITTTEGLSVDSGTLNRQTLSEATLLSDFNGGRGVSLGDIRITDSSGATYAVDLNPTGNEANTLGDVIDRINTATSGAVVASLNATGDGLLLTDTADGDATLTVAEVGSGTTAADLRLVGASTATDGQGQQTIDGSTANTIDLSDLTQDATAISLASLNNGEGVDLGVFQVVASNGNSFTVNLGQTGSEAFTVGDVIDRVNAAATAAGVGVTAALNEAGTGIELTDSTFGAGELTVEDLGSDTAAADLNLIRTAADSDSAVINGSGLFAATDAEQGALATLAERINDLDAGVTASVLQDANGFRLSITADATGAANELLINTGGSGLTFTETSRPQDAVALLGAGGVSGGVAVTSATNEFENVVAGLDLTINDATGDPVAINVGADSEPLVNAVQSFVNSYNSIRSNLDVVTAFDAESATTGILFGRNEVIRVDTDLARIVSGGFSVGGGLTSLEAIGVSLNDDGTLSLNRSELQSAIDSDAAGVETLLTDENSGLVSRLNDAIDQLAFNENSLLTARSQSLQRTIDNNNSRIEDLNESLGRERDRLLLEFFRLEETVGLLQSNLDAISSIQPITIANSSGNA